MDSLRERIAYYRSLSDNQLAALAKSVMSNELMLVIRERAKDNTWDGLVPSRAELGALNKDKATHV
jgi:hypothetical protein